MTINLTIDKPCQGLASKDPHSILLRVIEQFASNIQQVNSKICPTRWKGRIYHTRKSIIVNNSPHNTWKYNEYQNIKTGNDYLHLFLAHAKQLVVSLCNNIDEFDVLIAQLFVASFFKVLGNLLKAEKSTSISLCVQKISRLY